MSKAEFTGERAIREMTNLHNLRHARDHLGLPPIGTFIIWKQHEARYKYTKKLGVRGPILDVACGTGYGQRIVQLDDYYGVDIAPEPLTEAKDNLFPTQADALALPFASGSFQTVLSYETIEHIANLIITTAPPETKASIINAALDTYCHEVKRVLKPDGIALISTPNRIISNPNTTLTDQPSNNFHSFELTEDEFELKLQQHFGKVEILHQCALHKYNGLGGRYYWKVANLISLLNGEKWKINNKSPKTYPPHYLVAICTK